MLERVCATASCFSPPLRAGHAPQVLPRQDWPRLERDQARRRRRAPQAGSWAFRRCVGVVDRRWPRGGARGPGRGGERTDWVGEGVCGGGAGRTCSLRRRVVGRERRWFFIGCLRCVGWNWRRALFGEAMCARTKEKTDGPFGRWFLWRILPLSMRGGRGDCSVAAQVSSAVRGDFCMRLHREEIGGDWWRGRRRASIWSLLSILGSRCQGTRCRDGDARAVCQALESAGNALESAGRGTAGIGLGQASGKGRLCGQGERPGARGVWEALGCSFVRFLRSRRGGFPRSCRPLTSSCGGASCRSLAFSFLHLLPHPSLSLLFFLSRR